MITISTRNLNKLTLEIDAFKNHFDKKIEILHELYIHEKDPKKAKKILYQANEIYLQYDAILTGLEQALDRSLIQTR